MGREDEARRRIWNEKREPGIYLGPVWDGSTPQLQQLQQKIQPNTPTPKLHEAANSMEL